MLGQHALGTAPLGGRGHNLPVVVITAPTLEQVFTTGGPSITVSWDYTGVDPQSAYRLKFSDDSNSSTFYDTGWVTSVAATTSVDLVDGGIPTDTDNVSVAVSVRSTAGAYFEASSPLQPFNVEWGVVTCTILDPTPSEVIDGDAVTASWSFSSTRSKTQSAYRVRLLSQSGHTVFHDSGWTLDALASSYLVPFLLSDGSTYELGVQLKNSEGVES